MEKNIKLDFYQQAARASWILPIAIIVLMGIGNSVMRSSKSPLTGIIMGGVFIILLLAGIIFGIIGCFGIKRHSTKNTVVPGLIGAILNSCILALLIAIAVPNFMKAQENSLQKKADALQKLADQTNKQLPVMANPETRVDKVIVLGPNLFEYKYTFVNTDKAGFDIEQFLSASRPKIEENYNTSDQFKMFRDNKISVRFSFYDKNGELITNIDVSGADASNK